MGHFQVGRVALSSPGENALGLTRLFSQEEIMEIQCELLVSNFKDPKTVALVKKNIKHISDGSSSHCAGALKLGLKKAFELKKQKRQPPGGYSNHVSYSDIGSNVICPCCGSYYLACVDCGYERESDYESCQGCGKRFIQ